MKRENSNLEWIGFSKPELEFICEGLGVVQEQFPENAEEAYNIKENIQYQLGNRGNNAGHGQTIVDKEITPLRGEIAGGAVLDFGAWLTVRSEASGPFGSDNATCGDMALLVAEFNKMRGYTVNQKRPAELDQGNPAKMVSG